MPLILRQQVAVKFQHLELILKNVTLGNAPLDQVGIVTSCACAAHCVLMPILIAALPLLGLPFLVEPPIEWMFVVASLVIGIFSLFPAYIRRHRRCMPLLLFGAGFLFLLAARLLLEERFKMEIAAVIVAASLIVVSHVTNLRLCKSCVVCSADAK